MCLSTVKDKNVDLSGCIVSGWKDFAGTASAPEFQVYGVKHLLGRAKKVPLDKWFEADKQQIASDDSELYDSGFHIYSDDGKRPNSASRRVYYRLVEVLGTQDGHEVIIAREMYVPSDPDGWPPRKR